MSMTRTIKTLTFLFVLVLTACSFNRFSSNSIANIRFKPLENTAYVGLVYAPETHISISGNSEFFFNLPHDEGHKYENIFVGELSAHNMIIDNDSNRFKLDITHIEFTENAEYECATDSTSGQEYCFWLNDLDITIKMDVYDGVTNKSKSFTSNVTESTKIKAKLIGDGYKESGDYLNNEAFLSDMMNSCFIKCAGKAAGHIRKQRKKHG